MKSIFFHLMPYPELPPDFPEQHRSVWVDIDPKLYDPTVGHQTYNTYLDQLEFAAECGFDAVGINEHHSNGYGLMPSPNIIAAALSRNCPDTNIVVLGDSVALYNPPLRVAEEIAMLDGITGGRMIAGFPVGSPMDTIYAYGQNPATLRERYHEGVDLIRQAWASDEVFSFNGNYNKLRYVNVWPRPVQQPHPPIWIPGGGSVDTWDWCAAEDLVYCYLSYFGYKAGLRTMQGFWKKVQELGKETNPFQGGFAQFIAVADTEAEAWDLYREPAEYFFNTCLHVYAGYADPPGYKTPNTVRAGVEGMVERAAREATARREANAADAAKAGSAKPSYGSKKLSFEDMVEKGYIILGDPTQVTEQVHELATTMNVGHLMVFSHFGNMDPELVKMNTEMYATKVMPEVAGLFEDDYEDHWWPKTDHQLEPVGSRAR
ncbi:MAG: LLM class flavin-dependent oxidoreductase [Acidimicrobiales bacterium]|nr:LLM class flavin-dependent oxidoreductase [Acidimicrobiales bacterium]MYD82642.1 LLM class flavin-dependent oxidoreductase [Acidimicrobiales bacterium]MYJ65502.1 LLM class flavin-dependent oxidoreductase [Acidimicrobiales bacterium]